jgi:conjugative transfer pilus assembly protein TraH
MKIKSLLFLIMLTKFLNLENISAWAGIGNDLVAFFNGSGVTTNVTNPGAHKDQSAGYYSGGGVSARNRVKNAQIATLQLPSINAGCGRIDMFMGGSLI